MPEEEKKETEETVETPEETPEEASEEQPEKETEEEPEKELSEAEQVYAILQDPEKAKEFALALARTHGIIDSNVDKPSETQPSQSIEEIVAAELGDDFKHIGPLLGRAISKAIESKVLPEIQQDRTTSLRDKANEKIETLLTNDNISSPTTRDRITAKMTEIVKEAPMAPNSDLGRYLTRVYNTAVRELDVPIKKKKAPVERIKKNLQDDEVNSLGTSEAELAEQKGTGKLMTPQEAVAAAMSASGFKV